MNKNPFVPQVNYPQPPLPPGPPPNQDYSAYWAAAAAQQQQTQLVQTAPPSIGTYNQTWTPPQPVQAPRPTPEQSALFANYGYGQPWNQSQRQQQPQPQFAPPLVQQQLPTAQPGYNPYQPQAGYGQPYLQQNPQPIPSIQYPPPQQQFFPSQQQQPQQQNRQLHHTPPQHMPPAKRQRFDGPNHGQRPPQPQPQFQPPGQPGGQNFNNNHNHSGVPLGPSRGSVPSGPSHRGNSNGNMNSSRGRGLSGGNNRGGMSNNRGRGSFNNTSQNNLNSSNRGGGPSAPLRPHNSRGNFTPNRGGGSFSNGATYNNNNNNNRGLRPNSSFRGRGGYTNSSRGTRHEGSFGSRDGPMNSSFSSTGKRDENRRSLTDFKILGLEIKELSWSWGVLPTPTVKTEEVSSDEAVKKEEETTSDQVVKSEPVESALQAVPPSGHKDSPPPSRIRIYFHTPVSADDSRPIPHASNPSSDSRKGKRKKLDEDDPDSEDQRRVPPPPTKSSEVTVTAVANLPTEDRSSMAPSVAASETDWLMASLTEGAGTDHDGDTEEEDENEATQIVEEDELIDTDTEGDVVEGANAGMASSSQILSSALDVSAIPKENSIEEVPGPAVDTTGEQIDDKTEELQTGGGGVSDEHSAQTQNVASATGGSGDDDKTPVPLTASAQKQPADEPNGLLLPNSQVAAEVDPTVDVLQQTTVVDAEIQLVATASPDEGVVKTEEPNLPAGESSKAPSPKKAQPPKAAPVIPSLPTPTPNRISIAYAAGNRRLVIDASSIEQLTVYRKQGRIEIGIKIEKDAATPHGLKGIFFEGLSQLTQQTLSDAHEADLTLPPFSKADIPSTLTMIIYLDTLRPLSEPKWVKFGDVQEWLKSECEERMILPGGDSSEGWEKKILVVDPDPPPTIWTVLDGWAANANSNVGSPSERHRFVKTHMADNMEHVLEVLLRLVRREGSSFSGNTQPAPLSPATLSGPLLAAYSPTAAHAAQQTHVSLAVLAMFRMSLDYATKLAGEEKGKRQAESRVGEIIRCLPSHLIYTSLDSIFKEWKVDKKGR